MHNNFEFDLIFIVRYSLVFTCINEFDCLKLFILGAGEQINACDNKRSS